MIRVAILSFWHVHARDYLEQAQADPATEIVAVWDETPERGHAEARALNVPFYEKLDDVLARADIDGVIVDTPTNLHHDVMIAAAQAGKHIFTEKVIAPTLREVNEILAAVEQAGVKFMVSVPRLYHGSTQIIREILAQQLLGDVTLARIRIAHDGALHTKDHPEGWLPAHFFSLEQCRGSAMIDLGSHPMYLSSVFLGMPESVTASYGYVTGREVEDNAVATLNYAKGSIGIAESSFVNRFSPFTIEIHGTEGSLFFGGPGGYLLIRSSRLSDGGQDWTMRIPQDGPLAFSQWVKHIEQGTMATENIEVAVNLTALMEAANISARTRCAVRLSSLVQ